MAPFVFQFFFTFATEKPVDIGFFINFSLIRIKRQ